jgi:transposase
MPNENPNESRPKQDLPGVGGRDPVAELEAFIAETEARGEAVAPEARAMLARLRELTAALRALTASLEERAEHGERTSPTERADSDENHH